MSERGEPSQHLQPKIPAKRRPLTSFDEVAALTVDPDTQLHELRERYETDATLTMTGSVLNVLRGQVETV